MTAPTNPYVGPRTFTEKEGRFFFGREREARDLTARIVSERLLLFYAQSGAGKSSLLNARVIPKLRDEERFQVLPVGRVSGELPAGLEATQDIFAFNLMASLDQGGAEPTRLAGVTLSDFLACLARETVVDAGGQRVQRWVYKPEIAIERSAVERPAVEQPAAGATQPAAGPRFVLIIDQFEELITGHPGRWLEREDFFRQLNQALLDDPNLWVVLTLREDYVAALDPYAELTFNRLRARFYMERMGVAAALDAICEPAKLDGRSFAVGVAEQLVDNLRQVRVPGQEETIPGQYVEPVQLQVVCYQLWENIKQRPPGLITATDLREAGDVDRALTQFYEETLATVLADPAAVGVSERQLRAWFDEDLITEAGTRGLVRQGEREAGGVPNDVVRTLQRRFLVRAEARGGDAWIELVHDRFVEPIRASNRTWLAHNLNPLTQAAQAWLKAGKPESDLYTDWQLAAAVAQIEANPTEFGEAEQAFVEAGQKADARRAARRQRIIVWGAVALSLVFIALAAGLWLSLRQARIQTQESQKARDTAVAAQQGENMARNQAEANATVAVAARLTAEAASTESVAALAEAQAANTAQVKAVNDLAVALQTSLAAQATATQPPAPTATATPKATPTGKPTESGINPSLPPSPLPTPTSMPRRTSTPPPPTANPLVIAQQTQLAQVRVTQTALALAPVSIGRSVNGQPIEVIRIGSGSRNVVVIGGLHAGSAPGTVELARQIAEYFRADPGAVPPNAVLHVVLNANPDSPNAPGQKAGRLNAHGVDLNRNWDCKWAAVARWSNQNVSGGSAAFSEPETAALRDYFLKIRPEAVVFWEAQSPQPFAAAGGCGDQSRVSEPLARAYATAAGYQSHPFETYAVTGDVTNWLDDQLFPAISVLLPAYRESDFANNLKAVKALLAGQ